jgi:outer membrane receptor for ferrienterochelin and colicin
MKIFYITAGILFFTALGKQAKAQQAPTMPDTLANYQRMATPSVYTKHHRLNEVQSYVGKTYGNAELLRMPVRDVNQIANTVSGVDSRAGGIPNIRGAASSGTAYFVDGVRVYGALPMITH